jgi:hypothetical protein
MNRQIDQIRNFLRSGKKLSPGLALQRFGITNLRARIHELRSEGLCVYTTTNSRGRTAYVLGAPNKNIVAAAYLSVGGTVFKRN